MFKGLLDKAVNWKADRDVKRGLVLVRDEWLAFKDQKVWPDEDEIVQFVGPFISPMVRRLSEDSIWRDRPLPVKLDLVFAVILADAKTPIGEMKLRAMREALGQMTDA